MINSNKVTNLIVIVAMSAVLVPFVILGNDYAFTVHDFLDSQPGYSYIMKKIPTLTNYNETSGIMGDMPAFYFLREINFYVILHRYFGFVEAEFINRFLAVVIGYFSMTYLMQSLFKDKLSINIMKLIAASYAVTPVLPCWSLGFAILPLLTEKLWMYSNNVQEKITWRMLTFIFAGFCGPFFCLGLFVCIIWLCVIVTIFIKKRVLNKALVCSLVFMTIGYVIGDAHFFIMTFSGVETNRILFSYDPVSWKTPFYILKQAIVVLLWGQYHAAPILTVIRPVFFLGCIYLYIKHRAKKLAPNEYIIISTIRNVFIVMCLFSIIYALDIAGVNRLLLSHIMPVAKGFNFGRIIYINNILWYIVFTFMVSLLVNRYKKIIFVAVCLQIVAVLYAKGFYQDTRANIRNCFAQKIRYGKVSYQQFVAPKFWSNIKSNINYNNEGVVSVGMHPSIAQANGFNTLDGYLSVHPMTWQNQFRTIIAPTLEKNDRLKKYYDTWGGRMYVFVDNVSDTEETTLLINTSCMKNLGGKYIFSRYKIINADQLGIRMIYEQDMKDSIYHIFVYEVV